MKKMKLFSAAVAGLMAANVLAPVGYAATSNPSYIPRTYIGAFEDAVERFEESSEFVTEVRIDVEKELNGVDLQEMTLRFEGEIADKDHFAVQPILIIDAEITDSELIKKYGSDKISLFEYLGEIVVNDEGVFYNFGELFHALDGISKEYKGIVNVTKLEEIKQEIRNRIGDASWARIMDNYDLQEKRELLSKIREVISSSNVNIGDDGHQGIRIDKRDFVNILESWSESFDSEMKEAFRGWRDKLEACKTKLDELDIFVDDIEDALMKLMFKGSVLMDAMAEGDATFVEVCLPYFMAQSDVEMHDESADIHTYIDQLNTDIEKDLSITIVTDVQDDKVGVSDIRVLDAHWYANLDFLLQ